MLIEPLDIALAIVPGDIDDGAVWRTAEMACCPWIEAAVFSDSDRAGSHLESS